MNRKYLMQGDLDGACFLYSIVNSIIALTSKAPTTDQWSNALQYIPFSQDFINGSLGTKNYDDRTEIYKFAIEQAVSEYSDQSYTVSVYPDLNDINKINQLITNKSVVILNISGEHWVCVVDTDLEKSTLLTACSDLGNRIKIYDEKDCRFNRKYNQTYKIGKKTYVYKSSVIQITLNDSHF